MGKSNNRMLNELLVNLFHNVMDAEAKAVITDEFRILQIMTYTFWRLSVSRNPRACPGLPGNCMSPWEP